MQKLGQFILKILSKRVLKKYQPEIIGITGSVGKTSAKEAVFAVLKDKMAVRRTPKNYNNELGVPLTILDASAPGKSLFKWLGLFGRFFKLIITKDKNYPSVLILELGVDRPGDMKYLLSIIEPKIGIVTTIGLAHLEYFKKIENTQKEKQELIEGLSPGGQAILNYDDLLVREMAKLGKAEILTYGLEEGADLRAQEISFAWQKKENNEYTVGTHFKLNHNGSLVPVYLPGALGYPVIYAALAAAAVGVHYNLNLIDISQALSQLVLPPGRMKILAGINNSVIIDDSYNASPQSVLAGLEIVDEIKTRDEGIGEKIAILGDMLELGEESEAAHQMVGEAVAKNGFAKLIVVGAWAKLIGETAFKKGLNQENIIFYTTSLEAVQDIKRIKELLNNSLVFVKGSQGSRLEKIVKAILINPKQAKELLVRQDKEWENK